MSIHISIFKSPWNQSFPSPVLSIHGIVVAINDFVQILGDDLRHPLQLLEVKAPFDHEGGQSDGR